MARVSRNVSRKRAARRLFKPLRVARVVFKIEGTSPLCLYKFNPYATV